MLTSDDFVCSGSECYGPSCDCLEEFDPTEAILDTIQQWFPGYTESNPQFKVECIDVGFGDRTFNIYTLDHKFIKQIRVSLYIEELDESGNPIMEFMDNGDITTLGRSK